MRSQIKIIYITLTVVALLVGFFMPKMILTLQISQMEEQVDRYELNSIELSLSKQLFEKLNTVGLGYQYMEISENAKVRMTEEEVYNTMLDINEEFGCFLFEGDVSAEMTPGLEISEGNTYSFVVWQCSITTENSHVYMIIDDATGKMLSFRVDVDGDDIAYAESIRISQEETSKLCEKLKEYYELSEVYLNDDIKDSVAYDMDAYGGVLVLDFILQSEMGEEMNLTCYIDSKGNFSIN